MGYVIAAVLVLLIVAAGVTFFVLRSTRTGQEASIAEPDPNTPLGDTDQHAGEQTPEGETVDGPQEGTAPGTQGTQGTQGSRPPTGSGGVGGEAEGGRPVQPESERLGDRPR
jgi:hypothetical protein